MVKIAVTGKGGVGKTTLAAGLARTFGARGLRVVALDMDPSPNLASSLACSPQGGGPIRPLVEMEDLILERTGAPPEGAGLVFRINPKVDDIPARFGVPCRDGVRLLVLGSIRTGGGGCFCPANALARRLVDHLSGTADLLVMDMEAGVEHLGRGTTRSVEALLVVTEPTLKSVEAAAQIARLARDLGITRIFGVVNKAREGQGEPFLSRLSALGIVTLGVLPFDPAVQEAEEAGTPVFDHPGAGDTRARIGSIAAALEEHLGPFGIRPKGEGEKGQQSFFECPHGKSGPESHRSCPSSGESGRSRHPDPALDLLSLPDRVIPARLPGRQVRSRRTIVIS